MKLLYRIRRILIAGIVFLFLMGCQNGGRGDVTPESDGLDSIASMVPTSTDIPKENIAFTVAGFSYGCAAENGAGLYIPGIHALSYYDFESQASMILCAQAGCSHLDSTCEAWLGENVNYFASYQGKWYVLDGGGSIAGDLILYEIDPTTHNKRALCVWNGDAQGSEDVGSAFLSNGYAYVTLSFTTVTPEGQTSVRHLDRVDLASGNKEMLVKNTDTSAFGFVGAGRNQVVLSASTLLSVPQTEEEYAADRPNSSSEEYVQYRTQFLTENLVQEIRIYDWKLENYTVLGTFAEGYHFSGDPNIRYGMLFVYAVNDTLHVYDIDTGNDVLLLTAEGIINFWIMDGNVFYIVLTHQDECQIWYCPLEGGTSVRLDNEGNTSSMAFSLSRETAEQFIGLYDGQWKWISKEDFYAERYDRAVAF